MTMVSVTPENLPAAAAVYRESWQESHRSVCTREFLESRDCAGYLRRGLEQGKQFYLLLDPEPVGVVSVAGREIGEGLIALTARAGWRRIRKNWKILAGRCVSSIVRYAEKNDT